MRFGRQLLFRRLPLLAGLFMLCIASPEIASGAASTAVVAAESTASAIRRSAIMVTTTNDGGEGSLRQAIHDANALKGPDTILFDSTTGPFATPQTIILERALPALVGELTIDGYIKNRLWKPNGVTLSGANQRHVFTVAPGAKVTVASLTIANGHARQGGGMVNRGELLVKGVTFAGNGADQDGGGLVNLSGKLTVINSTFVNNRAGNAGGGVANDGGTLTVTNCTFSENTAQRGGGLFSSGTLLLRNTILANSEGGPDCVATGELNSASTHNLIETHDGCGQPISTADPRLQRLGSYNGPAQTLPLGGSSPAINLGDNGAAVDEHGEPLRWDQRGNGDPRFVAGITDVGAFERQAFALLVVDTIEDIEVRACTRARADCSLRGAITLTNATPKPDVITFDAKVFSDPQTITLTRPLPDVTADLTIDARGAGGVTVRGDPAVFRTAPDANLTLHEIRLDP